MKTNLHRLAGILVLGIALASCSSPAQPASSATLEPTNTPEPGATSTSTPTATPTLTRTPEPTDAPTSTPDFYVTATALVKAVVATSQPTIYASYPSPDGEWRADVVIYDCVQVMKEGADTNAYEQLKIIRVSDGMERVVADQLQFCGGLGAYGLGGLFWSPNSRYFYFTDAREGVPDGGCGYWERPIIRLDMTSQNLERLHGGPFSPDRTKIAIWEGRELVLWSLDQGELARTRLAVSNTAIRAIAWSPDSRALVYVQTGFDCYLIGQSYVVRLDLPELKHTLLLESDVSSFIGVIWDAPNRIRLFDEQGKEWRYNLVTKELKTAP